MDADVLVVGAGPAGLAVAACLRRRGVDVLVVDRGAAVGDSWRRRYDRLHLHTPRVQSALPGLRIPRRFGRWVAKDDVAAYLAGLRRPPRDQPAVRHRGAAPRAGRRRLDGAHRRRRRCGPGRSWSPPATTGRRSPPDWPGQESFAGDLLHASAYANPEKYRGKDVLVVGAGNTGAEIAADLAEGGAARVWLAVRTPPNVVPRQLGPIPTTLLAISMDFSPAWLADPINRFLQRRVRRRPDPVRAAGPAQRRRQPDAGHRGHPDHRRRPDRGAARRAGHPGGGARPGSTATRRCWPTAPGSRRTR